MAFTVINSAKWTRTAARRLRSTRAGGSQKPSLHKGHEAHKAGVELVRRSSSSADRSVHSASSADRSLDHASSVDGSVHSASTAPRSAVEGKKEEQRDGGRSANVTYRGVSFETEVGTTMRTAMLENGVSPHNGRSQLINCRGLGTCGTCAVEIRGADVSPSQWTTMEQARLNFPPHSPPGNQRLRLACQVQCMGDLEVIKRDKFWGQGETIMPDMTQGDAWIPLGKLETVVDQAKIGIRQMSDKSQ
mmetsp:Transcript_1957/g.2194  ORF Transcript_1957/g.2194 Transcript_1957/m.2194 type:complete len:247 (+) Transcript_1957:240-980(+)